MSRMNQGSQMMAGNANVGIAYSNPNSPHYGADVSRNFCMWNLDQWESAAACMDAVTTGRTTALGGAVTIPSVATAGMTITQDQALTFCTAAKDHWQASAVCLSRFMAGSKSDNLIAQWGIGVCSHNASPAFVQCTSALMWAQFSVEAANYLCDHNSSDEAVQCAMRHRFVSPMLALDDRAVAVVCSSAPATQPVDADRVRRCLLNERDPRGIEYDRTRSAPVTLPPTGVTSGGAAGALATPAGP